MKIFSTELTCKINENRRVNRPWITRITYRQTREHAGKVAWIHMRGKLPEYMRSRHGFQSAAVTRYFHSMCKWYEVIVHISYTERQKKEFLSFCQGFGCIWCLLICKYHPKWLVLELPTTIKVVLKSATRRHHWYLVVSVKQDGCRLFVTECKHSDFL